LRSDKPPSHLDAGSAGCCLMRFRGTLHRATIQGSRRRGRAGGGPTTGRSTSSRRRGETLPPPMVPHSGSQAATPTSGTVKPRYPSCVRTVVLGGVPICFSALARTGTYRAGPRTRRTLLLLTPEKLQAWAQNLGHEEAKTTCSITATLNRIANLKSSAS